MQPQITVGGTCPGGSFVQIFRNGIFAGTTACSEGLFSLKIDLVIGKNDLVAKVFDNLGQFGPDSAVVTVYYEPQNGTTAGGARGIGQGTGTIPQQLLVTTDSLYQGVKAGSQLNFRVTVNGGKSPYAIIINWGDGTQSVFVRSAAGQFNVGHIYQHGGIYKVTVEVTDMAGNKAALETVILVNGIPPSLSGNTQAAARYIPSWLTEVWPFYLILVAIIASFWLGSFHRAYRSKKQPNVEKLDE